MAKRDSTSETDIAARVVAWLEHEGWDVYKEVEGRPGRCDIYAVREPVAWAIEVKTTFGLRVIEQAHGWLGYANLVSVAVPYHRNGFAERICRDYGIGTIETSVEAVHDWSVRPPKELLPELRVREIVSPRLWRRCVRPKLYESQKASEAGNAFGKYVTGASEVKRLLVKLVAANPGIALNEAMRLTPHHYANAASARSTVIKYIEWNQIPEVRIERQGRTVHLYPMIPTPLTETDA